MVAEEVFLIVTIFNQKGYRVACINLHKIVVLRSKKVIYKLSYLRLRGAVTNILHCSLSHLYK
jgi:hypothetical protein